MRLSWAVAVWLFGSVQVAAQQYSEGRGHAPLSRDLGCRGHETWAADITAPEWAKVVRACIARGEMEKAVAAFWVYNSYLLFDQQRVRDESAHVVKSELNGWIFAGLSRDQIDQLKVWVDRMRQPGHAFHAETCGNLARLGPPQYRPDYMIVRGMIPRKSEDDWKTEGFDRAEAWDIATVAENGCGPV